jgi:hypothetical protein
MAGFETYSRRVLCRSSCIINHLQQLRFTNNAFKFKMDSLEESREKVAWNAILFMFNHVVTKTFLENQSSEVRHPKQ